MTTSQLFQNVCLDCLQFLRSVYRLHPVVQPEPFRLSVVGDTLHVRYQPAMPRVFDEVGYFILVVNDERAFNVYHDSDLLMELESVRGMKLPDAEGLPELEYRLALHRGYVRFKRALLRREYEHLRHHAVRRAEDDRYRIEVMHALHRLLQTCTDILHAMTIEEPNDPPIPGSFSRLERCKHLLQSEQLFEATAGLTELWLQVTCGMYGSSELEVYTPHLVLYASRSGMFRVGEYLHGRNRQSLYADVSLGYQYQSDRDVLAILGREGVYAALIDCLERSYAAISDFLHALLDDPLFVAGSAGAGRTVLVSSRAPDPIRQMFA